ncbi:MAG: c-type cytochrome [Pseudomonadota bacterium]
MKNIRALALAGAVCTAMSFATTATAADAEAGAKKAETCLGCHGVAHYVNTYPTYHVPKLAGQHELYLVAALKAYRDKQRSHATMHANAAALSDEDIADIAAYLASANK